MIHGLWDREAGEQPWWWGCWGFWLTASWMWSSRMSWQPKGPTVSWGAPGPAPPAGRGGVACPAPLSAVRPHLMHLVQLWVPQSEKVVKPLESVQRRGAKTGKGLEGEVCEGADWGPVARSAQSREAGGRPHGGCSSSEGVEGQRWALLSGEGQDGGWGKVLHQKVMGPWNRLPRAVGAVPGCQS